MKRHVLILAGCIALASVAMGQNEPAPAAPAAPEAPATPAAPAVEQTPATPAAPATPAVEQTPATPATPAPATPATPVVEQTPAPTGGVLPATSLSTNTANAVATADVTQTNAVGAELVPLIVIDDVPLLDAVKNLARQAGLNYLPDPKLSTITNQPNVTMRLEKVSAQDALTAVLDTYGLQIIHDPRIRVSRITVKDPKAADPLFTKIIQLKHTHPSNVVDIVKRTLSPNGNVMGDLRTSQLIVVATEKEFPAIEEMILKLDTPTRQVLIEAQIWETAKNPRSVKGIDWQGTFAGQNVRYGNGTLNPSSEVITTLPGTPQTVPTPGGGSTTYTPNSSTTEKYSYTPGRGITLDTARGFHPATAFLSADGLNAVISLFNTDTDTEVVATPRAVTMDNQPATLSVTRAFPIFKITPGSANSPAGSEITYTNLGTILYVTPHIAANSNISMRVIPEVSDIAGVDVQDVNGFRNTANIYAIRRMETHVSVPNGNTLVLGGLISDRLGKTQKKVPFLGDVPGLGHLFRHEDKERDKANLVVFVTPTIVGDGDFQESTTDFLQTKQQEERTSKDAFYDSAKPYDWTKPKDEATTAKN
jgi:type II secretory pathway component GspD/PulD (secretin)